MERNQFQHPNTNADYYRSLGPSDKPAALINHLQFITVHKDGTALVGGSNMTNRYWCGRVWFFNNTSTFNRNCFHATANTVCDAAFLTSNIFLLAEDGGGLQTLSVNKNNESWTSCFVSTAYACHHYDSVTSIAVFESNKKFLTCSKDLSLKVWELEKFIPVSSFETAHTKKITSIDVMPNVQSVFLSTSMDRTLTIWDTKKSTPAQNLYEHSCGLTASSWSPINEHEIAVGGLDGTVTLIDTRQPGKKIFQIDAFSRQVHKLKYHPKRESILAGCCDDIQVKVMIVESDSLSNIYIDDRHTDFVRSIAWNNDDLLSCSWDNTILNHPIKNF